MENYSVDTNNTISQNIIDAIAKLKKQNKRADVETIHKQVIKISDFQYLNKECLQDEINDLINEGKILNKLNRNKDSFHINKDILDESAGYSLGNSSVSLQNVSFATPAISPHKAFHNFNIIAETPTLSQTNNNESAIRETETFIEDMFENIKIENIKKDIIHEIQKNVEKHFQNELLSFKSKCEKLLSKSYLNSKTYVEKLEKEIENKDKIIKRLLTTLETFSSASGENNTKPNNNNTAKPTLTITKTKTNRPSDEFNILTTNKELRSTMNEPEVSLENQLKTVRDSQKERYYSQLFGKIKDPQGDDNRSNENSQKQNLEKNKTNEETKTEITANPSKNKKIKKKTVLVIGDSMLNGIEESKLSKSRHIRVQPLSGARIEDLQANIDDVLHKDLQKVVIHAGTNNSVDEQPTNILDKLETLANTIKIALPECSIVLSTIIKRTDDKKACKVGEKVNHLLKSSSFCVLENSNINEKHLGKRGLHLNSQGNAVFASNLLKLIKNE